MGKSCWMARVVTFSHIFLPFAIFKLLLNFIFQCYRLQTWQFYLVFPALFISGTHKMLGLKFNGGSRPCKGPILLQTTHNTFF